MKLRHPSVVDVEEIVSLASRMHRESWFSDFDFDQGKVADLIRQAMRDETYFPLVVDAGEGEIVGFFLAAETEHFFGRSRYACDIAVYLAEQARGGPWFFRMVKAYEAWCRHRGVQEIHMGFSTGINEDVTSTLYARMGYQSMVQGFRKKCV